MKILVLSDMGQHNYHVGDEAMGIAAADEMIARGHDVVFLTRDPEHTRTHIGTGVDYFHTLQFPWPPAEREARFAEFRRFLDGERNFCAPEVEAEFARYVDDVASVDAVLMAGGGNLNSVYGWLLYERAALVAAANFHGKQIAISGQSVGPVLTGHDAQVLGSMLNSADLVSMREPSSQAWCRQRGIASVASVDDATFYAPKERTLPGEGELYLPDRFVSVTFNNLDTDQVIAAAALLDRISNEHGLTAVFVPHQADPSLQNGDVALHQQVADRMKTKSVVLPAVHTDTAVRVHREACIVLTTRYHPAVLALAYGVPSLGLISEAYTDVRLGGAMGHFGMGDFALSLSFLTSTSSPELVFDAFSDLVNRRAEISAQLQVRSEELRTFETQWWDDVATVLAGGEADIPVMAPARPISRATTKQAQYQAQLNAAVREAITTWSLRALNAEADLDRERTYR